MCQCPQRASTYFFPVPYSEYSGWGHVSMPSTGFYLFLLKRRKAIRNRMIRVNALNGLLLISSTQDQLDDLRRIYVSMPSTGFYLFLQISYMTPIYTNECVNALNGLLLISSDYHCIILIRNICVNALNGLLLISSVILQIKHNYNYNVSMPSTGFYLFLQYPPRTLDFTEFWRGFLQVIN